MPIVVGLDTSFVLGLIDEQDLWHAHALSLQAALDTGEYQIYIFDCVLAEVISLLARRTHEKRRTADFAGLVKSLTTRFPRKTITWLYPDLPAVYDEILALAVQSLASFDADFDRVPWLKRIAQPADLSAL